MMHKANKADKKFCLTKILLLPKFQVISQLWFSLIKLVWLIGIDFYAEYFILLSLKSNKFSFGTFYRRILCNKATAESISRTPTELCQIQRHRPASTPLLLILPLIIFQIRRNYSNRNQELISALYLNLKTLRTLSLTISKNWPSGQKSQISKDHIFHLEKTKPRKPINLTKKLSEKNVNTFKRQNHDPNTKVF